MRRGISLPHSLCWLLNEQFWPSDEVVGGGEEAEHGFGFGQAPEFEPGQSGAGLGPAEDLLDTFSAALADVVARMTYCAVIYGAPSPRAGFINRAVDRDMRRHLARPQLADEVSNIISLIRAQRDALP